MPLSRRLTALVALAAYLAAALGPPISAFPIAKDLSQPFPCQAHACGCRSAEECWAHCCCFTPEQRWTWAEQHDVTPPAYAQRPADDNGEEDEAHGSPCCSASGRCCLTDAGVDDKLTRRSPSVGSLRCRGATTNWIATGAALPVQLTATWTPFEPVSGAVYAYRPSRIVSSLPPIVPPPRSV
jgi:hypothetical protein